MKKILLVAIAMLLLLTGCKKEVKQLEFNLANLSTLLDRSADYVLKASPGVFDDSGTDYMWFKLDDVIEGIDKTLIYYDFVSDKCDFLTLYSYYTNYLEDAEVLIQLAEDEVGEGEYYSLKYYDASSVLQSKEFTSLEDLLKFITDNSLTVNKVDEVMAIHHFNDTYFMSGGYYDDDYDAFYSVVEIGWWDDLVGMTGDKNIVKSLFRQHDMSHQIVK